MQPRRRSVLGIFFTIISVVALVVSVLINIYFFAAGGVGGFTSDGIRQTTLVEGNSQQKIALVPIENSFIGQDQADLLDKMLGTVEKDSNVKAVVVKIDTPGGAVTPSDEMYHRLQVFKTQRPGVPVIVSMGGLATSGGYYAACGGDYLFAEPTTITGNIGVLEPWLDFSKLADKWGVEDRTLHSTGADYKTAGSWLKPPTPQDTAYLTGLLDAAFAQFKSVVVAGRATHLTQTIDQIANGKAYTAAQALQLGLIDAVGYPADAYAYAAKKAGLTDMTVVRYDRPSTFADLFTSNFTVQPAKAVGSMQGASVSIDAGQLDGQLTPRMLYLWKGY